MGEGFFHFIEGVLFNKEAMHRQIIGPGNLCFGGLG
jgi:hypothetical protein